VRDLPAGGRPVVLFWVKRVWGCAERARRKACRRVGKDAAPTVPGVWAPNRTTRTGGSPMRASALGVKPDRVGAYDHLAVRISSACRAQLRRHRPHHGRVSGSPERRDHTQVERFYPGAKPQTALGAEDAGAYEVAPHTTKREIRPGETFELLVHITGYGTIGGAKLVFYPPPYFVDERRSFYSHSLREDETGAMVFGSVREPLEEGGTTLDLSSGGVSMPAWGPHP
jgi:hypothetical protein